MRNELTALEKWKWERENPKRMKWMRVWEIIWKVSLLLAVFTGVTYGIVQVLMATGIVAVEQAPLAAFVLGIVFGIPTGLAALMWCEKDKP